MNKVVKGMKISFFFLLMILFIGGIIMNTEGKENFGDEICNIKKAVPEGWECTIVTHDLEKAERPHGMWKPLAIIYFINPSVKFKNTKDPENKEINPSFSLYFYDITEKNEVMKVIKKEAFYSWAIPIYFDETGKYIMITSPAYINHGVFSDEAKKFYAPLEKSLKEYFSAFKI
jgi:hypothetical protein